MATRRTAKVVRSAAEKDFAAGNGLSWRTHHRGELVAALRAFTNGEWGAAKVREAERPVGNITAEDLKRVGYGLVVAPTDFRPKKDGWLRTDGWVDVGLAPVSSYTPIIYVVADVNREIYAAFHRGLVTGLRAVAARPQKITARLWRRDTPDERGNSDGA